ncbi:hypothetical protein SAMN04488510_1242 [Fervidobacterium changbaicum]|uniref:DUF5667 domain-containing protein n=1 Tax=Fervidobacterium changbaicum TaxID=310769 RepID=A0ABX5QQI6_9BACT|nr:hypothetical protein [Fervidobacterium changbaicum]QAV32592.1 hypothetical protein CBS1_01735 [Fervidobacterium changbaicum]SDH65856.1 hypothetical protein SAMN04488510_1242 [Fervidobacterium changbaicum]
MDSKSRYLFSWLRTFFVWANVFIFLTICTLSFANSSALQLAKEGALTLEKSVGVFFPFNLLFFYVGSQQLASAVQQEPFSLEVRLIRIEAFFKFVESNRVAQDVLIEDGEFLLLFKERVKLDAEVEKKLTYILAYTYGLKKDIVKFSFYVDKLRNIKDSKGYLENLEKRFPSMIPKNF